MPTTEENLATAFAGESQANRRYLAFAKQAEKDGYKQIAKLFRAIAEAETVHALNHFKEMGGIKSTLENLKAAYGGEDYEVTSMYPPMVETAKKEGKKGAERTFGYALAVEKVHRALYEEAIKAVEQEKDLEEKDIYVCPVCGHTMVGDVPDECPVCGAKKEKFMKIE